MHGTPDQPAGEDDSTVVNDAHHSSRALVVRPPPVPALSWSDRLRTVLRRVPDLARDPAMAATTAAGVTVAGQLAFRGLRRALGAPPSSPATLRITAVIVHRVDIVHHFVADTEGRRALPPS